MITPDIPSIQLPSPPRKVRKNYPACFHGWLFVMAGRVATLILILGGLYVLWDGIILPELLLPTFGTETTAQITSTHPGKNKGSDYLEIRYSYNFEGSVIQSGARTYTRSVPDDPIRIRYLHLPGIQIDEIAQPHTIEYWSLAFLSALWFTPLFFFAHFFWRKPRQMRRLCKYGMSVQGTIKDIDPRKKSIRGWVSYTYISPAGQLLGGFQRVHNFGAAEKLKVGSTVTVLTMGPGQSTIYELCLYRIEGLKTAITQHPV